MSKTNKLKIVPLYGVVNETGFRLSWPTVDEVCDTLSGAVEAAMNLLKEGDGEIMVIYYRLAYCEQDDLHYATHSAVHLVTLEGTAELEDHAHV